MHRGDWKAPRSIHGSSISPLLVEVAELVIVDRWSSLVASSDGEGGGGGDGDRLVVVLAVGEVTTTAAAAAATLWMDLGDMALAGRWLGREAGKLKEAEEPLRQRRAAS